MDKLRIVWICHFSNSEIQNRARPFRKIKEFAPWISSMAKVFEDRKEVELFIIAPHEYICCTKKFSLKGINYVLFNAHIPIFGRHWPAIFKFDEWTNYYFNKYKIARLVKKIKPNLIHLQGAENEYYSSSIFQFKYKYPTLITIQGFLHKVLKNSDNNRLKRRVKCELQIYKDFQNFGVRTIEMQNVIKSFNPDAKFYYHGYGIKIDLDKIDFNVQKAYDLVFFASVTRIKGIEDYLKLVEILSRNIPEIKAAVIGPVKPAYKTELDDMIREHGIDNNIEWIGFLPTLAEVHQEVVKARVSVLPVEYDMIPGTIIESMLLKVPVVTYKVGSIPEVNEHGKVIFTLGKGDINGMFDIVSSILSEGIDLEQMKVKARNRALEMLDADSVYKQLYNIYMKLIKENEN